MVVCCIFMVTPLSCSVLLFLGLFCASLFYFWMLIVPSLLRFDDTKVLWCYLLTCKLLRQLAGQGVL
ncbi:hypothetical protein ES288_D04G013900v1 [Gossypium darwinii]|uniref:Uncharacterized protein n=2 Tax=Gossypium TaxID=3633 RepID=A0A5D2L7S2_GOSTO|nr:hypothetical protein ES288_D04G013900v1 [Gossypium darwinii]TYH75381.1 hypothetical protein ES332_D04G015300v1 [Gossypium tomentosum]